LGAPLALWLGYGCLDFAEAFHRDQLAPPGGIAVTFGNRPPLEKLEGYVHGQLTPGLHE